MTCCGPGLTCCQSSNSLFANLRQDADGIVTLSADGVLRSLNADHTTVIDYLRLSNAQLRSLLAGSDQQILDAAATVDGRDVTSEAQLFAVPEIDPALLQPGTTPVKRAVSLFRRDRCSNNSCVSANQCQAISCSTCLVQVTFGGRNQCIK